MAGQSKKVSKVLDEWTTYRAPIENRKVAYHSFGSIKHTVPSSKKNGVGANKITGN